MGTILLLVLGAIVVALILPATRSRVIDTFVAIVNAITFRATTDTERRRAHMDRGIAQDKGKLKSAKQELQDAMDNVQTLRGNVITAQRHKREFADAVLVAQKEVLRTGRFVDNGTAQPGALVRATSALTEAEAKVATADKALIRAVANVEIAVKQLGKARQAVDDFQGLIHDEEANAALATSLNLTTDIGKMADGIKTDLGATSAEAIKQEVDRAEAGVQMQTDPDEEKMRAAEAKESAADVLARVRKQTGEPAAAAQ